MAAGSIVIDLLMKTGSFETDTKRAEKRIKDLDKELKSFGKGVATTAAAAATAFAVMSKQSINRMDEMGDMAQSLGLTVDQISKLGKVAEVEGFNLDEFGGIMSKLVKTLADARSGAEGAGSVFKTLGIDPSTIKDSEDALLRISDKFASYEDGLEKTALAQELFGKSGAKFIAFLNQGSEGINQVAEELSVFGNVSTEAARQSGQFNDSLSKLNIIGKSFTDSIVKEMLPALNSFLETLINISIEVGKSNWSNFLPSGSFFAADDLDEVSAKVLDLRGKITSLQERMNDGTAGLFASQSLAVLNAELQKSQDLLFNLSMQGPLRFDDTVGFRETKGNAPQVGGGGAAKESEYDKYLKSLQEQIATIGVLTEHEKVLAQIQLGKFGKLNQDQQLNLEMTAQQVDTVKKSQKAFEEYSKAVDDLTGFTQLQEFTKQMDFLSKALKEGRINADQYTEAVNMLSAKFETTTSEMGQFAIEAARNIQNILGDAMLSVLEGKFSNIGDAFSNMLKRMVSQLAASQLSSLLFGQFDKTGQLGGLIGAAGSAIAGAFNGGFGTGNAYGNQDLGQFFAEGGYTGDGGNMEAAGIVHKGEYVLNAKATQRIGKSRLDMLNGFSDGGYVGGSPAGGMMGGNVNINIKNEAGGDGYQATATARRNDNGIDIDVLVRRAVSNDLRSNGQITQQLGSVFGLRRTA